MGISVTVANASHATYADDICQLIHQAALQRATGIADRSPRYIQKKMTEEEAVIALDEDKLAGFCYIESWDHEKYIANSGLIVHPSYRGRGLGKRIKRAIFELSRERYPKAKVFGITTSPAVMKINSGLGYRPVTFAELTGESEFWDGCQSCPNYDILNRTGRKHCLCTGMLYDPEEHREPEKGESNAKADNWKQFIRFLKRHKNIFHDKATKLLTKNPTGNNHE